MKKGFTLLELTIVIAIIGVITATLWASYNTFKENYKDITPAQTPYNELVLPQIVDYESILQQYGIDTTNLTDDEIKELVEKLKGE